MGKKKPMMSSIDPKAKISGNVKIGNFCTIHANVVIGEGSTIEDYCTLGYPTPRAQGKPLVIGRDSYIRSYSILYEGSEFGDGLLTGHHVLVRELTRAGQGFQIGSLCDVEGNCTIGNHVKFHSNVLIAQKTTLHDFVWIFPHVTFTNDPHPPSDGYETGAEVFDYAVIATKCCLLPGVKIGEHALVAAYSLVIRDVDPYTVVTGSPAKKFCRTADIKLRDGSGKPAYPWNKHFHRGYPPEIVAEWVRSLD